MIIVTRLHGASLAVNCDLIERVEAAPGTVLTLVDGSRYVVRESGAEIVDKVLGTRADDHHPRDRGAQPREEFQLAIESAAVTPGPGGGGQLRAVPRRPVVLRRALPPPAPELRAAARGISRSYLARHTESAVVLTKEKERFVKVSTSSFDGAEFIGILSKLTLLHLQAGSSSATTTSGSPWTPVFNVITHCLQVINRMTDHAETPNQLLPRNAEQVRREPARQQQVVEALLRDEYARAEDDFDKVVQGNAWCGSTACWPEWRRRGPPPGGDGGRLPRLRVRPAQFDHGHGPGRGVDRRAYQHPKPQ